MAKKQKNIKPKTIEKLREISKKYKENIGDILSSDEFRELYSDMNYKEKEFCQVVLEGIVDAKNNDEILAMVAEKENQPTKSVVDMATDEDRAKEVLFGASHFIDDDDDLSETENKLVEDKLGVEVESEKPKKVIEVEPQEKMEERVEVKIKYLSDVEKKFGSKKETKVIEVEPQDKMEERVEIVINEVAEENSGSEEIKEPEVQEPKDEPKVEYISDIKGKKEAEEAKQEETEVEEPVNLAMYKDVIIEEVDHNGIYRTTKSFNTDKVKVYETVPGVPLSQLEQNQLWFLKNVFPSKYKEVMGL